jgi:hypothetical protein
LGKGGKNGSGLVLKMACDIKNWRPLWNPNSIASWSSCLKKPLSLRMP